MGLVVPELTTATLSPRAAVLLGRCGRGSLFLKRIYLKFGNNPLLTRNRLDLIRPLETVAGSNRLLGVFHDELLFEGGYELVGLHVNIVYTSTDELIQITGRCTRGCYSICSFFLESTVPKTLPLLAQS